MPTTFYALDKQSRDELVLKIHSNVFTAFDTNYNAYLIYYFDNEDTYIRKAAYLSVGKIFFQSYILILKIVDYIIL
jgi:hypothetical protein